MSEMEWARDDPGGFWAPSEFDWASVRLCTLPRIVHKKLHWPNFQFDLAQAIIDSPDSFQNAPLKVWKDRMAKQKRKAKGQGICEEPDGGEA